MLLPSFPADGNIRRLATLRFRVAPAGDFLILIRNHVVASHVTVKTLPSQNLLLRLHPSDGDLSGKAAPPDSPGNLPGSFECPVRPFVVVLTAAFAIALFFVRGEEMVFFGFFWFSCSLPSRHLSLDNNQDANLEEHRIYLPSVGVLLVLGQIDFRRRMTRVGTRWTWGICMVIVAAFLVKTVFRTRLYRDP